MNIFYRIMDGVIRGIKGVIFALLVVLLLPIIILNYFFVLYAVIASPTADGKTGVKGQVLYEAWKMSIESISTLYRAYMNEKEANCDVCNSKVGKHLMKVMIYLIVLILSVGSIWNMCISG